MILLTCLFAYLLANWKLLSYLLARAARSASLRPQFDIESPPAGRGAVPADLDVLWCLAAAMELSGHAHAHTYVKMDMDMAVV